MAQSRNDRLLLTLATIYRTTLTTKAATLACNSSLESVQDSYEVTLDPLDLRTTLNVSERIKIALMATEYHMNFLRFSISPSTGLNSITIDAIEKAQYSTRQLEAKLLSLGAVSEEDDARAHRTETCFQDIISTLKEWRPLRSWERPRPSSILEPLFRTPNIFGSEIEKTIMTRLRSLHLKAATLSTAETIQELSDLCHELRPDSNILSEAMRDTALRSVILILCIAKNSLQKRCTIDNITENAYDLLESCFITLNQPADLMWKEANCPNYKTYFQRRRLLLLNYFTNIKIGLLTRPRTEPSTCCPPEIETMPDVLPSALWQKLQSVESVAALTDGRQDDACAICLKEAVCKQDFAILSQCLHFFCIECIADWLNEHPTCPTCRTTSWSWTTKRFFEDFMDQRDSSGDTERPAKRLRRE